MDFLKTGTAIFLFTMEFLKCLGDFLLHKAAVKILLEVWFYISLICYCFQQWRSNTHCNKIKGICSRHKITLCVCCIVPVFLVYTWLPSSRHFSATADSVNRLNLQSPFWSSILTTMTWSASHTCIKEPCFYRFWTSQRRAAKLNGGRKKV